MTMNILSTGFHGSNQKVKFHCLSISPSSAWQVAFLIPIIQEKCWSSMERRTSREHLTTRPWSGFLSLLTISRVIFVASANVRNSAPQSNKRHGSFIARRNKSASISAHFDRPPKNYLFCYFVSIAATLLRLLSAKLFLLHHATSSVQVLNTHFPIKRMTSLPLKPITLDRFLEIIVTASAASTARIRILILWWYTKGSSWSVTANFSRDVVFTKASIYGWCDGLDGL